MKETYYLKIQLPNGKIIFDYFKAENEISAISLVEQCSPKGSIILDSRLSFDDFNKEIDITYEIADTEEGWAEVDMIVNGIKYEFNIVKGGRSIIHFIDGIDIDFNEPVAQYFNVIQSCGTRNEKEQYILEILKKIELEEIEL